MVIQQCFYIIGKHTDVAENSLSHVLQLARADEIFRVQGKGCSLLIAGKLSLNDGKGSGGMW